MGNAREKLGIAIINVLIASASPLRAREIADALHGLDVSITKSTVNSILYSELSAKNVVVQDSEYRWSAVRAATLSDAESALNTDGEGEAETAYSRSTEVSPEECRAARRVLHTLRAGTTSCGSVKTISVGTARIQRDLYSRLDSLREHEAKGEAIIIAADWGFGKSHVRMLLSSHLSENSIPFIHECIDARAASLAHVHRSVHRWLERVQFGRTIGLRDALSNGHMSRDEALGWAMRRNSDFACALRYGLWGHEWGWLRALGHFYRTPDYPYQHPKAWAILDAAANFLGDMGHGGLVLLLDEAENIDKQYDIRGRRKSYDTLAQMMQHPNMLPVLFVTDRFLYQVEEDAKIGGAWGWSNWSAEAKWFVRRFREMEPVRPPQLTDQLAKQLVDEICSLYGVGYPNSGTLPTDDLVAHWRQTPTRSIRLLVRLTINELDLAAQNLRKR